MRIAFTLVLSLCLASVLLAQESDQPQLPASPPLEAPQLRFDHLTVEDGLAEGTVSGLYQDRQGFIWIASAAALQRYDGYSFRTYRFSDLDSTAIPFGQLERIIEDAAGRLYLGSAAGLYLFDPAMGKARRLYPAPGDTLSGFVPDFVLEGDSVAWLATVYSGIVRLDLRTGARRVYQNRPGDPESLSRDIVIYLYLDPAGILWASTLNGLNRLDPATGKITRYPDVPHGLENILADPTQPGVIWIGSKEGLIRFETRTGAHRRYVPDPGEALLNWVNWLAVDPADADVLWMTTMYGGLLRFDTVTEQFTRYRRDEDDPNSLVSDQTWSLLVDRGGTIWVGTEGGGLSRFDPAAGVLARYQPVPSRTPSPEQNDVRAVFEDRGGALWMGVSGTVYRLDRLSGMRSSYRLAPDDIRHGTIINSIVQDAAGGLWVGVAGHGVFHQKTSTDAFVALPVNTADSTALCDVPMVWWETYTLLEDRAGRLWVGTDDCLHRIEPRTGRITRFHVQMPADSTVGASILFQDKEGRLWAGSYGLLASLDPATGRVERIYRFEPDSPSTFSGADINGLYEREREPGVLWIGTTGGLDRLDTRTGTFTHFTEQEGLPAGGINAILEDDGGRLWMSTNSGIVRFDPERSAFQHYGRNAGLRASQFNRGAAFRSARGELFFGGVDGVYSFFPEQFRDNPHPPQVALTGLRLFNEKVEVGASDSLLKRPLSETGELRLRHDQDVVTFEYVALHYKNPEKNTYAYRLEGFDTDWVQAGSRREATYTNLDPEAYTFRVKAASADGLWNEQGASLRVVVQPPWWRTGWAYALYALLLAAAVFAVDRIQRRRLIRKERERAFLREKELRAEAAEHLANYLHAENERKTQELEQARHLQLSMLPKTLPEHPTVEIAAHMQTATEVGGDYYDVHLADDGTLTLAIGDATGHGLAAGTMVTAMKGLFTTYAEEADLELVMHRCARTLKQMHLPRLYMALALGKLNGRTLELVGAGMPPALVYRSASGCIEELPLKGLPLGSPGVFPYSRHCVELSARDTVVLMSDGFPELFNGAGQMLGYACAVEVFAEVAERRPEQIITHLRERARAWCDGKAPGDDVTFLVMQVKPKAGRR